MQEADKAKPIPILGHPAFAGHQAFASPRDILDFTAKAIPGPFDPSQLAELTDHFPAKSMRRLPRYVRCALLAAVRCLASADLMPCPDDMPVFIGSAYSCQSAGFDFMDSMIDFEPRLASPLAFTYSVNNVAAGALGMILKTHGECMTVNNGTLSFAGALDLAAKGIAAGRFPYALVGAAEDSDSRFSAIFPAMEQPPAAIFFLMKAGGDGAAVSVEWDNVQLGPKEDGCAKENPNALFQAAACLAFLEGEASGACAFCQHSDEFGISSRIV